MLPFRTEIRNTPKEQTIKVYLSEICYDQECMELLQYQKGIKEVVTEPTIARNREAENLTIYCDDDMDINHLEEIVSNLLDRHFAYK